VVPPLEFYLMTRTYNTYGGHSTLSLIPDILLADAPMFGSAIKELTITFNFPTSGPPRKSLDQIYARFHSNILTLPKVVFRRNREQASIDVASNLIDGDERKFRGCVSASLLKAGYVETVAALRLLKSRLTAKDDFKFDAFLSYAQQLESSLPETDETLAALKNRLVERRAAAKAAMSPWERLGIEWRDFHPEARRILDDPFYWKEANDFSPHGNDTGADLLADYRSWLEQHSMDDPIDFYQHLISRWGFSLDTADPTYLFVMNEAAVALAFAELKLRGNCRPSAVRLAMQALERQRQEALVATDWHHRDERLRGLNLIEAKLKAVS
jgi:uncharacterized protein YfeS